MDSYVDQFSSQPEHTLGQFLEANPNFTNPRDIGRILYHTDGLSPYSVSVILFNSNYSSRALIFSFMTAIDLDCVSFVDAISLITQKSAIPTKASALMQYASSFASAYGLRNQLEWPDSAVVRDLLLASISFLAAASGTFSDHTSRFESLRSVLPSILTQMGAELSQKSPAIYFSSVPVKIDRATELTGDLEHEGRFRSTWSSFKYSLKGDEMVCKDAKGQKAISYIKLASVFARQKTGVAKKPWCFTLQTYDNREFGEKVQKDGTRKPSSRTSYVLACKSEADLLAWISAVNQVDLFVELEVLRDAKP
jgi:hypothetical protein